jgi:hypothetical protein
VSHSRPNARLVRELLYGTVDESFGPTAVLMGHQQKGKTVSRFPLVFQWFSGPRKLGNQPGNSETGPCHHRCESLSRSHLKKLGTTRPYLDSCYWLMICICITAICDYDKDADPELRDWYRRRVAVKTRRKRGVRRREGYTVLTAFIKFHLLARRNEDGHYLIKAKPRSGYDNTNLRSLP